MILCVIFTTTTSKLYAIQKIDLRDNIGILAIEILKAKENIADLSYDEIMRKTLDIIEELHEIYDKRL